MKTSKVAIIPARGGSKRLPNKNILGIENKPMITWTIKAAIESHLFEKVLVATDCEKIAQISVEYGAEIPFLRTPDDSDDYTPISVATVNFLKQLPYECETVVQLMANCPCRTSEDIKFAIKHFESKKANFQISVFKFGWMNPWWAMKVDENSKPDPIFQEALKQRSQDLQSLYCPTGAIWIAKKNELLKSQTFYGPDYVVCPMNWENAVDIDDEEDLKMAEIVMKMRQGKK